MRVFKAVPLIAGLAVSMAIASCSSTKPAPTSQPAAGSDTAAGSTAGASAAPGSSAPSAAGSSDDKFAALTKSLAVDEAVPVFTAPGPSLDISTMKGKTVFVIPQAANPFVSGISDSMSRVAKATGVKMIVYPNQGQSSQWIQGMQQAIAQKVDLIVLSAAPDPRELQPQLAAAKAAGIPVVVTHFYDDTDPMPPDCLACAAGVTATVAAPFNRAGKDEADWIIKNTQGKAHVLIVGATEDIVSDGIVKTMAAEYKDQCGAGCSTKVILIPPSEWGTKVSSQVASALNSDPSINVVDCLFDAQVPGAVQAIRTIGKDLPVVSFNGSTSALTYIQKGDVAAMDVGESVDWIGYAVFDQIFRVLLKQAPVKETLPIRIWDATNINDAGTPPDLLKGYGDGYVSGFKKLWGLAS